MELPSELPPAISDTIEAVAAYATQIAAQVDTPPSTDTAATAAETAGKTGIWAIGSLLLFLMTIIPQTLLGIATFTSITLPTWLFTLFSTTLTVTMNATTL